MCTRVLGEEGRGSFMSCHGKLTVYLKKFTDYHLKSNIGSLSANIKHQESKISDSLPGFQPYISKTWVRVPP